MRLVRSALGRTAMLLLCLAALSCASTTVFQLSPEEEAALRLAMDSPLTFVVARDQSIASWDRAQEFINRYSSMKLRSATDSTTVSYENPVYTSDPAALESGSNLRYGYSVSRSRDPGGIRISVQCTPSGKLGEKDADQNAHIAAYYIRTGTLGCTRCIVR